MKLQSLTFVGLGALGMLASSAAFAADGYHCRGTEPFWGMQIRGSQISYSDLQKTVSGIRVVSVRAAEGTSPEFLQFIQAKTPAGYPVTVIINANESCSDGMSDEKYTHQAVVEIGGTILFGCCN